MEASVWVVNTTQNCSISRQISLMSLPRGECSMPVSQDMWKILIMSQTELICRKEKLLVSMAFFQRKRNTTQSWNTDHGTSKNICRMLHQV